jgi:DivIVA domain-containing protein
VAARYPFDLARFGEARLSVILSSVTNEMPSQPKANGESPQVRRPPKLRLSAAERARMHENLREVDFPFALRGYDRDAVDRYVKQVNRVIAELELSSSPESAVRHALEEVSEETSGLLQRAYETAEEITARSRSKADDRLQQAEREAQEVREEAEREVRQAREAAQTETGELREAAAREARELRETAAREAKQLRETARQEVERLRAEAEARVNELERDAEAIARQRRRLIEDVRALAQQQLEIAEAAAARFPQGGAAAERSSPGDEREADEKLEASDQPTAVLPEQAEQI